MRVAERMRVLGISRFDDLLLSIGPETNIEQSVFTLVHGYSLGIQLSETKSNSFSERDVTLVVRPELRNKLIGDLAIPKFARFKTFDVASDGARAILNQ